MMVAWIAGSVCLLLACGCAQGIFHWLRKSYVTSRWPTVSGKITSSWEVLNGERVKYDYEVGGKHYAGHRVCWGPQGGTAEPTYQELAEKYPPGREVMIYYDPKRPATAVLEPRNPRNLVISVVFTLAFGSFGAVFSALAILRGG
jgi:hypothetical protein